MVLSWKLRKITGKGTRAVRQGEKKLRKRSIPFPEKLPIPRSPSAWMDPLIFHRQEEKSVDVSYRRDESPYNR